MLSFRRLFDLSVQAAISEDINEDNLECYWYGPWNTILSYYSMRSHVVIPQYEIRYQMVDSNNRKLNKCIVPDFVVMEYSDKNGDIEDCIRLIVENKRACEEKDLDREFKTHIEQLNNQVSALFSKDEYNHVYGIIAIGKYWKWTRYEYVETNTHKRTLSNESYKDGDAVKNYKRVKRSGVLDMSSDNCQSDFDRLMKLVRE